MCTVADPSPASNFLASVAARLMGMAKAAPVDDVRKRKPPVDDPAVSMPSTWPWAFTNEPPESPGWMLALVWIRPLRCSVVRLITDPPPSAPIRAAGQGGEPERALQVEADHLVPHGLGDLGQVAVEQGHAGVVDQHVDPAEGLAGRSTRPSSSSQWPTLAATARARRPMASTSAATARQASSLRLATTTSAPASAKPRAMARPSPRLPPVTRATRPVRSNRRARTVVDRGRSAERGGGGQVGGPGRHVQHHVAEQRHLGVVGLALDHPGVAAPPARWPA